MNAKSRRKIEMGTRALEFSRAHPDPSPGYTAAVTRLEELLSRGERLAAQQREGTLRVRAATARKRDLRRRMKEAHLLHLTTVAKIAAREVPELAQKLTYRPNGNTYLGFRTAARGMAAEAAGQQEVLVRYGLVESVLESLTQALDQFDAAVESGGQGRQAHVGASAELVAVADEVQQIVKVMDALNRFRFASDGETLAAWESASNVIAPARGNGSRPDGEAGATPGGTAPGGEVRPAA